MDKLNCFSLTVNDHVAHLVLNKPESLNTMHPTFWRELDTVLHQLNNEGKARALVISSTGKHFSAGMALETFSGAISMDADSPEGRAAIFDSLTDMQATFTLLESMRIPVIAAIHGGCIGGAVDMVSVVVRSTLLQLLVPDHLIPQTMITGLTLRRAIASAREVDASYASLYASQQALAASEVRFRDVAEAAHQPRGVQNSGIPQHTAGAVAHRFH